jgi:hypothetical protein
MRYVISLLLFIISTTSAQSMPDFEADYMVSTKSMKVAQLHQQLTTNSDNTRTMATSSKPLGLAKMFAPDLIQEKSNWQEANGQLHPISYAYDRTGGKKEKHITTLFDWTNNQINIDYKGRPYQLPLSPNTFDNLSYQQALINDLVADKKELRYSVVDKYRIKQYTLARQGTETITTPFGEFEAIKLVRQRIKTEDNKPERQTTLWCAPALNYLPIKLEHIEKDGSKFIALLQNLIGIQPQP